MHTTAPCPYKIVIKSGLHHYMGQPFLPKLCPKATCLCWLERRRHSMANCSRIRAVDNGSVGHGSTNV